MENPAVEITEGVQLLTKKAGFWHKKLSLYFY